MKRFISALLVLLMLLSLVSCGRDDNNVIILDGPGNTANTNDGDENPPAPPADKNDAPADDGASDEDVSDIPDEDIEDIPPEEENPDDYEEVPTVSDNVTLYFSDDSGVNFITYPASLESTDAAGVLSALKDFGVIDSGVKIVNFSSVKNNGEVFVKIDLNKAFGDQIAASGDGYGYMLLGSVVNTLIDAYDAAGVALTVNGNAVKLNGTIYSGYLTAFGANPNPPAPEEEEPEEVPTDDNPIVATALSLVGAPYEYGGSGPNSFDNSGFVYYCFKANGITIPRRTSSMFLEGIAINKSDLQKGDAVFFSFDGSSTNPTYVAIYIGDGKAIAESNENNPVSIFSITTSYYTDSYVGARRFV